MCASLCEHIVCVCVYVYGPVQYTLGDGDRFPWQQLECCMDRSDVDVFVHACEVMCVCVCSYVVMQRPDKDSVLSSFHSLSYEL